MTREIGLLKKCFDTSIRLCNTYLFFFFKTDPRLIKSLPSFVWITRLDISYYKKKLYWKFNEILEAKT